MKVGGDGRGKNGINDDQLGDKENLHLEMIFLS
jgi:hypothetical protein